MKPTLIRATDKRGRNQPECPPDLSQNDELLVSYNVNDRVDSLAPYTCPSQCVNIWNDRLNADTYRPKFFRVLLELIAGMPERVESVNHSVKPNPVRTGSSVIVSFDFGQEEDILFTLTSISGQFISENRTLVSPLKSIVIIEASSSPGVFLLKIISKDKLLFVTKLVVVR